MEQEKTYTQSELVNLLTNLENFISNDCSGILKGEDRMPKRKQEKVILNGKVRWISGYSNQELLDSYVELLEKEGLVVRIGTNEKPVPLFGEYLKIFIRTFKNGQESLTSLTRDGIIKNHINPRFGKIRISDISTTDIQTWFNELEKNYAHETLLKIKNIMSPVFNAAVEDGLINRNPFLSDRIKIGGKDTVHHKAIPKEKMVEIRNSLIFLNERDRRMTALLSYTGMRFEEVLGSRWEDYEDKWIRIERAVVHPTRNMPEIKKPKTKTSKRVIPYSEALKNALGKQGKHGFLLYSEKDPTMETPLSYSEARRAFDRIRIRFDLQGYTAHDFRDTCATEWRENGMPLDVISRMLGHSKSETTEKRYVKYREELLESARQIVNGC